MKGSWQYIKVILVGVVLCLLFAFSNHRNEQRKVQDISVKFMDENQPFISLNKVNKLLIQNNDSVTSIPKEVLDLNSMEVRLTENPMVREAEVFITVDGKLHASIEQRSPIGRVLGTPNYYIDMDGKRMPLSEIFSARVPLVTGVTDKSIAWVTPVLRKIQSDSFMKNSIVALHLNASNEIELTVRKHDFKVLFGTPDHIDKKFQNFKAFYKNTKATKQLEAYNAVNLKFIGQVVATNK